MKKSRTFTRKFNYRLPNFFTGAAKILDLGNTLTVPRQFYMDLVNDRKAISNDWRQIGQDIYEAMEIYDDGE